MEGLDPLVDELERVAAQLRAGDLPQDEAARLVERCAELASRIGGQLDAAMRAEPDTPGQERLL